MNFRSYFQVQDSISENDLSREIVGVKLFFELYFVEKSVLTSICSVRLGERNFRN